MKKQIISKLVAVLVLMGLIIVVFVALQTRNNTIEYSLKKAQAIADVVQSGLTAHMVNKNMDEREAFLNSITNTSSVEKIWLVRGENVIKQYGKSKLLHDQIQDDIDRRTLKTGIKEYTIIENLSQAKLRVTIPYKVNNQSKINCLECHNVKYGETLGAVSLVLDISDFKNQGLFSSLIVLFITFVGIVFLLIFINKIIKPYIKTLELLKVKIEHAQKGEFREIKVDNQAGVEIQSLVTSYNQLTRSLMKTFTEIENKLKGFLGNNTKVACSTNPLMDAADIVTNLSYIYQFKKEVQSDKDIEEIFARLGSIFQNQFQIKHLNVFEIKNNTKVSKIYSLDDLEFCFSNIEHDCLNCRALRNGECLSTLDFQNACPSFTNTDYDYACIELSVGQDTHIVFNFLFETKNDFQVFQDDKQFIKNYIKEALPEIEMKMLLRALEEASLRDGLTGLYNRRFFDEHMKKLIPQIKRTGRSMAFMMLDIDHFKAVNDEYGHDIGDKVLIETAQIIEQNVREGDLVIRFGGEEFIVILVDIENEENAYNVAMKLKEKVSVNEIDVYAGSTIRKTTSVGFSMFPKDSHSLTTVMKYADLALYEAKENGRDQVRRYAPNQSDELELF